MFYLRYNSVRSFSIYYFSRFYVWSKDYNSNLWRSIIYYIIIDKQIKERRYFDKNLLFTYILFFNFKSFSNLVYLALLFLSLLKYRLKIIIIILKLLFIKIYNFFLKINIINLLCMLLKEFSGFLFVNFKRSSMVH
jgi:hypothetical protein